MGAAVFGFVAAALQFPNIHALLFMKIEIQSPSGFALFLLSGFFFFNVKILADPTAKPVVRGAPIAQPPQPSLATGTNAPRGDSITSAAPIPITTNSTSAGTLKGDQFIETSFDKLAAFTFKAGSDAPVSSENAIEASRQILAQIPASVKALNEKRIAIRGFMLPMKLEHGRVIEFLLLRNQMGCCYGIPPSMNEVIDVRTNGKGLPTLMDDPVTAYGTLHIVEVRENGYLTGIYKLDCERVQ
jgi:hypothetical protein